MANKTASEVVAFALEIAGITGLGESADGNLQDRALSVYTAMHGELQAREARRTNSPGIHWQSTAVPEAYFSDIAAMLAGKIVKVLPVGQETAARAMVAASEGEIGLQFKLQRKRFGARTDAMFSGQYSENAWPRP